MFDALTVKLTYAMGALALLAAGWGLIAPEVYRETQWVIPQNRGQDLITLAVLPALLLAAVQAARGSVRMLLLWLGLVGYLAYTYTGAAFSYHFNILFPAYVALFGLTGAALIMTLIRIDPDIIRESFDRAVPARGTAVFLAVLGLVLAALWGSQIMAYYIDGRLPEMVVLANTPTVFVYVLDLGVVVPLALAAAVQLWKREAWGFAMAGFVLVKATTMGLALVAMTIFASLRGVATDATLGIAWVALAIGGFAMSVAFFRHCKTLGSEVVVDR